MGESSEARIQRLERELDAARAALRASVLASESRYRTLVESSTDVVFITAPRTFVYVSPSMKTQLGHEPSELIGKETMALVHPDDRPRLEVAIGETISSRNPVGPVKVRVLHADGTYRVVELVARNMVHDPSIGGVVVNLRDVTERERSAEELRHSEARLRGVFDGAVDAMFIADDDARYIDVNSAGLRLLGVERGAVVGRHTHDIFPHPDAVTRWKTFLDRGHVESEIVLGEGDARRFLEIRGRASVFPGGHLGIVHDATGRRKAEQALADSERRFRVLVESSADVCWISVAGRFVYISPAMKGVLGFAPDDLLGADSLSLVHPDDHAAVARMRSEHHADPKLVVQIKTRLRHRDGGYRVVEMVGRGFTDEPTIGGFVINFHDVTDRERALEDLRRAQAIGRIGSWTLDVAAPDAVMQASPETLRIYGIDPATFDGNPWSLQRLIHPVDFKNAEDAMTRAAATGGTFSFDARILREGETGWVHVEGVVENSDDGRGPRVLGTTLDITAMRRAEEELRVSEARYRRIMETTREGVGLVDASRVITYVNRRMAEMLGYATEEMIGRSVAEFIIDPVLAARSAHIDTLKQGGSPRLDLECRKKDGSAIGVALSTTPLFDEQGAYEGVLMMLTDITERQRAERAEETLRATEEQLRQAQKLEALGQLAGGVAHDFNNILSVILGYTSMLTAEMKPSDPVRADISEIHHAGERASELTRQLLAFSRKQVLQPRLVDVKAVIARTEKMLRRLLGEDIELQLVESPESTIVKADPGQLEQVLLNLAVNARDAMPSGGRLLIEAARTTLSDEEARALGAAPGPYVEIIVVDNGTGMDEAVLAHVFEPFFTTKEKGKGTGLGLSTVFGVVKQSAGHVSVTSTPGEGTRFRILLPREESTSESILPVRLTDTPSTSGEVVLLVEDDDQLRTLTRNVLQRAGYRVLEAATPGEAILISEQHVGAIDLLLTDVVMPRMGGHPLALRLAERRPDMKVLYVSGYTDDMVLRHGVELGQLAFLAKPFTPASLCAKVREVLELDLRRERS